MINRYNNFIVESILNEILLESKLVLMKDFITIMKDISSDANEYPSTNRLAKLILSLSNIDINISQNFIDIDKESDKVSFIPDNRVDMSLDIFSINIETDDSLINIVADHPILTTLGISKRGLHHPGNRSELPSNRWRLIKTYNGGDAGVEFAKYTLHYIQNIDDTEYYVVVLDNSVEKSIGLSSYYDLSNKTRGKVKIGRFINKLLDVWFKDKGDRGDYSASDVERFVNVYSAKVLFNSTIYDKLEIVQGEDIRKWYYEENYLSTLGQLGSSCMRYDECQKYLDIYVYNSEVCKLLILRMDDKILGRALLWIDIEGNKWIDRIYTYKDNYKNLMNEWAIKNDYKSIYDTKNIATIKIKDGSYKYYPYMDTFEYIKTSDQALGQTILTNNKPNRPFAILQETNGGLSYYN